MSFHPPLCLLDSYQEKEGGSDTKEALFLTKVAPFNPAKITTIRSWIIEVLQETGINASAGSTRAAAASYAAASRVPINKILEAADWSRMSTLHSHYLRILPSDVVQRIHADSSSVQDAILSSFTD